MINVKEVIRKKRSVYDEYCTVCEEFLSGDGSIVRPWKCGCGEYTFDWIEGWQHPKPQPPQSKESKSNG